MISILLSDSKTACLSIYWPVCDVYIAHTTIKPEVSICLTEMPFLILQVNFHTSNDFCDWRLLKVRFICKVIHVKDKIFCLY